MVRFGGCAETIPAGGRGLASPQGIEQAAQGIVVKLVHERQQLAQFTAWKSLARKPAEIVPRQVRDDAAFVFPVRHFTGQEELKVFRFHK